MKANAIRLYKHFCEMAENPKGTDSQQRNLVRETALKSKKDMEKHFRTGRKYRNDPEIKTLLGEEEEIKEEVKKEDGKKPKG